MPRSARRFLTIDEAASHMQRSELQDLIDQPNETLTAEYKAWLDLAEPRARASLARHIAALSNGGGGVIVMGFEDDMSVSAPDAARTVAVTRDAISAIAKRYLDPAPQCDVQILTSAAGNTHCVVVVPAHGATPVCAKANGPDIGGKIQGIAQGVFYVRKTGPESAPILTPADWAPVIRRCAMHDRSAILAAVNAALRTGDLTQPQADALKVFAAAARAQFDADAAGANMAEVSERVFQFSYAITREDGEVLDVARLPDIVTEANNEARDRVRSGWTMFYPFTRDPIAPYFATDPGLGDELEFYELKFFREPDPNHVDMWRLAPDGRATMIRAYWEDDVRTTTSLGLKRGEFFSPNMLIQDIGEFVRHAQAIAERFKAPTTISFRCEWQGLSGRQLFHPNTTWLPGSKAQSDARTASGAWPLAAVVDDWPEIVAALAGPVMRAFTSDFRIDANWVRDRSRDWLQM